MKLRPFGRGAILAIAGSAVLAMLSGVVYSQGPATLVQILTGGAVVSNSNPLPVSASVSASIAGFPTTQSTGTPISVTTGGVTGTLPSGTVVVATNVGTTNAAYCKLGASATTSDQYIAPSGGWFAFTVGANTQLTCITSTSTTSVNMVGGSGLPTGTGGGSGGSGGSSSITTWAGGTLGAMANYGTSPGAVLVPGFNAFITNVPAVSQSGAWNVTNITGTVALPTGAATAANQASTIGTKAPGTAATNSALGGGVYNSAGVTLTDGQQAALQFNAAGNLLVSGVGVAIGSTTSGQTGSMVMGATTTAAPTYTTAQTNPLSLTTAGDLRTVFSNTTIAVTNAGTFAAQASLAAAATGGCTPGVILTAASNNSTSIKASAGTLCELSFLNTTTGVFSVRLYDTASAPTCSSATGVVANYVAQSNATSPGFTIQLGPYGKAFTTGIGVCITGANANNDNTNAATGGNLNYAFK